MRAKTITFANFKGGTGKTTNCTMIGYILAKKGYRVLVLDQDPQANATDLYLKTKARLNPESKVEIDKTLMAAVAEENLQQVITEITDNLYLLPSYADYSTLPLFLEKKHPDSLVDRTKSIAYLLEPLKQEFDFILIDVPPTLSIYTDTALMASDYTVIVLQTQERSLVGAESYIKYLQELIDNYNAQFDILGILPVLLKNNAAVDMNTLENAKEKFGEKNIFKTIVKNMERLKRYDMIGIVDPDKDIKADIHDKRIIELYEEVTEEFLKRIEKETELYV
ncbi:ParA family protein (plasmid) [Niallia circulans]|uniref:ParA family protein n=1 Tax=Niallia circulans TaxID=1397 RepID=A0A553SQJ4_NIACI|nr:AAA family ATPase [Niallia circulans]TRZ39262.1 ParA family protein [Niallia circulans]